MLLLLLNEPDTIKEEERSEFCDKFKNCLNWKIADLFDVSSGVLEERFLDYLTDENGKKREIDFIKMDTIRNTDGKIEMNDRRFKNKIELKDKAMKLAEDKKKSSTRIKTMRKEISIEKILRPDDYLISTRGEPKGISLLELDFDIYDNLVPTHHFIVLRPKAAFLKNNNIHLPLLHLYLDLLVEEIFIKNYTTKIEEVKKQKQEQALINKDIIRRSAASFFASVKVDEVKEKEISVPRSIDEQINVYYKMKKIKEEIQLAIMRNVFWREEMFKIIDVK